MVSLAGAVRVKAGATWFCVKYWKALHLKCLLHPFYSKKEEYGYEMKEER